MKPHERLSSLLRDVPEAEREAAALRFVRYLEIVIAIADEAGMCDQDPVPVLTDDPEPPTLSYSV